MNPWNKKPSSVICNSCTEPALSICTKDCNKPFCAFHGIAHDLSLWSQVKLLSLGEEIILPFQEQERQEFQSFSGRSLQKEEGLCSDCSFRLKAKKFCTSRLRLAALAVHLIVIIGLVAWACHSFQFDLECSAGIQSFPGAKCIVVKNMTKTQFLMKHEFLSGATCKYQWPLRTNDSSEIPPELWVDSVVCKCFDKYQKYDLSTRKCVMADCLPTDITGMSGQCISREHFESHNPLLKKDDGCPIFTRFSQEMNSCIASPCQNPTFFSTEHGDCQQCLPFYSVLQEGCFEFGVYHESNEQIKMKATALREQIKPNTRFKSCSRDQDEQVISFNDSLGQLQCITPDQIYKEQQPCKPHEVANRYTLNCTLDCPPFKRFSYLTQACEDFACESPSKYYKQADGRCFHCPEWSHVVVDGRCVDAYSLLP